jgi:hypothetical protein
VFGALLAFVEVANVADQQGSLLRASQVRPGQKDIAAEQQFCGGWGFGLGPGLCRRDNGKK